MGLLKRPEPSSFRKYFNVRASVHSLVVVLTAVQFRVPHETRSVQLQCAGRAFQAPVVVRPARHSHDVPVRDGALAFGAHRRHRRRFRRVVSVDRFHFHFDYPQGGLHAGSFGARTRKTPTLARAKTVVFSLASSSRPHETLKGENAVTIRTTPFATIPIASLKKKFFLFTIEYLHRARCVQNRTRFRVSTRRKRPDTGYRRYYLHDHTYRERPIVPMADIRPHTKIQNYITMNYNTGLYDKQ